MAREWKQGKLGDFISLTSGGTPSKGNSIFWGGDLPWISAKDMKSFWIEDSEDHLTAQGALNATRIVDAGTTLILVRGMTLHHDVPICRTSRSATFNQDVKAVFPKNNVDSNFVTYLLLGHKERILSDVDFAGHGTGRIRTDIFLDMPVAIPPKQEQKAIASIFEALDDKIELNRQMNQTLEKMGQALFKEWFVDFGPVRAKAEVRRQHSRWTNEQISREALPNLPLNDAICIPETIIRNAQKELPNGWYVAPLDSIAIFLNGLALQKYPSSDPMRSLPVIKIAQLRVGNALNAERCSANIPAKYIINNGDIIFSWSGSLECNIWTGGEGALNQHLFNVIPVNFPKWFCYRWVHFHLPEFKHIAAGKATTMGHIQRHHLTDAKVIIADSSTMKIVNCIFSKLYERTVTLNLASNKLAQLRDMLLPKLISGEIRIKDAEKLIGKVV